MIFNLRKKLVDTPGYKRRILLYLLDALVNHPFCFFDEYNPFGSAVF